MEVCLDIPSKREWSGLTRSAPFEQSWAYGAAALRMGAPLVRIRLSDNGRVLGIAQGILRRFGPLRCLWLPRGVYWLAPSRTDAIAAIRKAMPGAPFVLSPDVGYVVADGRAHAVLSLDGDLRARMTKKWRNRLSAAERAGLQLDWVIGCPEWLRDREMVQRKVNRYRALPSQWLKALTALAPGQVETWVASVDGAPVAGMTFVHNADGMMYHLGHTDARGRATGAHNLLMWHAMQTGQGRGRRWLDLGMVDAKALPGLTRFKLGTGAKIVQEPPLRLLPPWAQGQKSDGRDNGLKPAAGRPGMVAATATIPEQ